MNLAFFRALTQKNQSPNRPDHRPCGNCDQCKCSKPSDLSAPKDNA